MKTKNFLLLALLAVTFFTACDSDDDATDPVVENPGDGTDDPNTFLEIDPDINLGTITFEETGPSFSLENENLPANLLGNWGRFGAKDDNNIEVAYVDNPNKTGNTSDRVVHISEPVGVESWAGMFFDLGETVTFPDGKEAIAVDFHSPGPGLKVLIKLEDQLADGTEGKKSTGDIIVETVGTGWETLVFNIPDKTWDKSGSYARFVIIAGFGVTNEAATDYYFDNIAITDTKEVEEVVAEDPNDDFEGNGNIDWVADACVLDEAFANPSKGGINVSDTVLKYSDEGGQYANIQFTLTSDPTVKFDLSTKNKFKLKVYVPTPATAHTTGQTLDLKIQNSELAGNSWQTQKVVQLAYVYDQWQELTFDFSAHAAEVDYNKLVIQFNGENNYEHVVAYIDDISYE